jgi:hypothetical protein
MINVNKLELGEELLKMLRDLEEKIGDNASWDEIGTAIFYASAIAVNKVGKDHYKAIAPGFVFGKPSHRNFETLTGLNVEVDEDENNVLEFKVIR